MKIIAAYSENADKDYTLSIVCKDEDELNELIKDISDIRKLKVTARTYSQIFDWLMDTDWDITDFIDEDILKEYDLPKLNCEYGCIGMLEKIAEIESRGRKFEPRSWAIEEGVANEKAVNHNSGI